jgi:hypothetical protein
MVVILAWIGGLLFCLCALAFSLLIAAASCDGEDGCPWWAGPGVGLAVIMFVYGPIAILAAKSYAHRAKNSE